MADFGQITARAGDDITFEFKRKKYKITPTVEQVLTFHRYWNQIREEKIVQDAAISIWKGASQLMGGDFNTDTYEFEGLPAELMEKGMDFHTLNRLLNAVHYRYQVSDDFALAYFETGDLGRAAAKINESRETPQATGETTEGD